VIAAGLWPPRANRTIVHPNVVPKGNTAMPKTVLYASVGPNTTQYDIDMDACTLTPRGTVTSPANVQYVWPHANRKFLYVASTDSGSGMAGGGSNHHVAAYRINAFGALTQHGAPIPLPTRPIHMATDIPSEHVLVAFNNPPSLRVYKINPDGTPGAEVPQSPSIDPGIFPHQVLATPDGRQVVLVARGFDATGEKPEEPGAIMLFDFADGILSHQQKIVPNGGFGFGPRHLDFHPTKPWVYVSLERQNQIAFLTLTGGRLSADARSRVDTLDHDQPKSVQQLVGTVHVHPNGRIAYVANRSRDNIGQNSLAVFALNPATGMPSRIQNIDTQGVHPRTFHIDPSGRMMVVAHIQGAGGVPCRLTTFRIAGDGTPMFAHAYDIDNGGQYMWWAGMVTIP
jgi:6-phosphogluconolactonase